MFIINLKVVGVAFEEGELECDGGEGKEIGYLQLLQLFKTENVFRDLSKEITTSQHPVTYIN